MSIDLNTVITIVNTILLLSVGYYLNKKLEEVKAQNQSRLAILPEQIKKYQEASTLLINMLHNIDSPTELPKAIMNCQDWFTENHVYLDLEAQNVFKKAYLAAHRHPTLLRGNTPHNEILENWDRMLKALILFQQSLQLPRPTFQKQEETPK